MSFSTVVYNEYIYLIESKLIDLTKVENEVTFLLKTILSEILNYITEKNDLNKDIIYIKNYLDNPVCIIKLVNAILLINIDIIKVEDIHLLLGNHNEIKK